MLDWFFSFFDRIAQSFIWKTFLAHFHWVDWFAVMFVIAGILYGLRNGLMSELAEILEILIVIVLTHEYYVRLNFLLRQLFSKLSEAPLPAVSFILTGGLIWFVVAFAASRLRKLVHTQTLPLLRISGGAVLGAVHALLIFSFMSQAVLLMPITSLKKAYESGGSQFGAAIASLSPKVHQIITERSFK